MIRDPELLNQLVDTIARFVRERLIPNEARLAEEDAVPAEILAEMKEMGLFGLSIPEEYGGLGLTMEEEALVAMEIGKTSPAFRSVFGTNNGIGAQGILIDGTDAQKAKYVPRLATGAGKTAIRVKDVAGFAVNRVLHAFLIEAIRLVDEGVCGGRHRRCDHGPARRDDQNARVGRVHAQHDRFGRCIHRRSRCRGAMGFWYHART